MYASISGPIFSDASPDSTFAIQLTTLQPVTQISPAPTSVVKGKDNVRTFTWTNFLDIGSDSPFAP